MKTKAGVAADGRWFSLEILRFSDSPRPDTKYVIFTAGDFGIQVKMITIWRFDGGMCRCWSTPRTEQVLKNCGWLTVMKGDGPGVGTS